MLTFCLVSFVFFCTFADDCIAVEPITGNWVLRNRVSSMSGLKSCMELNANREGAKSFLGRNDTESFN